MLKKNITVSNIDTKKYTNIIKVALVVIVLLGLFNLNNQDTSANIIKDDSKVEKNNTVKKVDNYIPAKTTNNSYASSGGGCGGGSYVKKDATETVAKVENGTQTINSIYTASNYLQPNSFKVKVGQKVKFVIDVKDSGRGCGYAIAIPELYDEAFPLVAGETITMEFTPTKAGSYDITCGMAMITYGTIIVE